ncbi:acid protease [Fusarium longipes]|uniref:Acid protease n=1 Tax=Fusarium longipes TaxID=694270 RepID=A0A395T2R5_9HYPO|nr:acid protease [Fusarium longipes]
MEEAKAEVRRLVDEEFQDGVTAVEIDPSDISSEKDIGAQPRNLRMLVEFDSVGISRYARRQWNPQKGFHYVLQDYPAVAMKNEKMQEGEQDIESFVLELKSDVRNEKKPANYSRIQVSQDVPAGRSVVDLTIEDAARFQEGSKPYEILYGGGEKVYFSLFEATVGIGGLKTSQVFGAAKIAAQANLLPLGILGLGFSADNSPYPFHRTLVVQLMESGMIKRASFALIGPRSKPAGSVESTDEKTRDRGWLVIGTLPDEYHNGITWCPVLAEKYRAWVVRLNKVIVNGVVICEDQLALIDTGSSYVTTTEENCQDIAKAVRGKASNRIVSYPSGGLSEFSFTFGDGTGEATFSLNDEDLSLGPVPGDLLRSPVTYMSFDNKKYTWILGGIFIDNMVTIFDYTGEQRIGFASRSDVEPVFVEQESLDATVNDRDAAFAPKPTRNVLTQTRSPQGTTLARELLSSTADTDFLSLDKASLLIIERITTMEENLLTRLGDVTAFQSSANTLDKSTATIPGSKTKSLNLWPNGDVILSWNVFRHAVARCGQHRHWEVYRHELAPSHGIMAPTPGLSLSIKAEFVYSDIETGAFDVKESTPDDIMADDTTPGSPGIAASLIRNYVVNIHSKSPILDLEFLRKLEDELLKDSQLLYWPVHKNLPAGLQPSDVAILLLVLALGEVSTKGNPEKEPLKQSPHIKLALPWLGVTAFSNAPPVKDLQAQLLLASYCMWILKPWRAWCYVEAAAAKAETILMRYPGIIDQKLSHRVLWAVAKMQLELTEEIYPHLGLLKPGRLGQLIQSTPIPPPPPQPFEWPSIGSQLDTDTWYYYLAETSSRRLVEQIKTELYNNDYSNSDRVSNIVAKYPLACEFERQINEWMSSLPADFRSASTFPQAAAHSLDQSIKQRMRKILFDRQGQLLMLVFRPFLAALADTGYNDDDLMPGNTDTPGPLLKGTERYLQFALNFLVKQTDQPVRHYGCWLLARNIWSTALSLIAACHIPGVISHMELRETESQNLDSAMSTSPMSYESFVPSASRSSFYHKALDACEDAHRLLRVWDGESKSLSFCADQLWALIVDAKWHETSLRSSNVAV